jgi:hypothetical protein
MVTIFGGAFSLASWFVFSFSLSFVDCSVLARDHGKQQEYSFFI